MQNCQNKPLRDRWKWIYAKQSGASTIIATLISNILGMLIFYLLLTVMFDSVGSMNQRNDVYSVCDRYLEGMMSRGYLSSEDRNQLITQLKQLGATNISTSGSSTSEVGYGKTLQLRVSFDLTEKEHAITNFLFFREQDKKVRGEYCRYATSYH